MKTQTTQNESISAMADGELTDAQLSLALASLSELHSQDGRDTWGIYHQIGDALRSDDLAIELSADFSSRFSALLEAEPVLLAPQASVAKKVLDDHANAQQGRSQFARYMAMTSMAAALAVAFFMAPQIIPLLEGHEGQGAAGLVISKAEQVSSGSGVQLASNSSVSEAPQKSDMQVDMLRDPRLDSYLLAHQKFSPAIGNGTQYVTRGYAVSSASTAVSSAVVSASGK